VGVSPCASFPRAVSGKDVRPIHTAVRGRARFRVRGLYRSEALARHLEDRLPEAEGIRGFSVNVFTGNLLVYFEPGHDADTVALQIEALIPGFGTAERGDPPADPRPEATGAVPIRRRQLRLIVKKAEKQEAVPWHRLETEEAVSLLGTSRRFGLSRESAGILLKKYGPNLLPESVPRSGWRILLDLVASFPNALLGVAAGISLVTGGAADAVVILAVVALNAAIGYVTETQSEKTIHSLKRLVRPSALVVRDGKPRTVQGDEIVPGDLLVLRPGSYIVADARLLDASHLSVDESVLTGESLPVIKDTAPLPLHDIPLGDRVNMVYMGTLVTGGQGFAVVVATARFTELGRIQELIGEARPPETPMERQLDRMGNQLVLISVGVCGLVFLIGLLRGYGLLQMLKNAISLAVAAVPEGLPTVATTTLALGVREMRRRNVLIRHLNAVETLGSMQTICLDKTGTLTFNRMSVIEVYAGGRRLAASDGRFLAEGIPVDPYGCEELLRLLHVSVLCNETEIEGGSGQYSLQGSSTENALVLLAMDAGIDVLSLRERHPLLRISHRSENRNHMATVHEVFGRTRFTAIKGSPLEVLAMCRWHIRDGSRQRLTEEIRLDIEAINERMAGNALRVLGLAYGYQWENEGEPGPEDGLIWLGLIGMADILRPGMKELVHAFHGAGIDTVMITGDQSPTAYAIGDALELSRGEPLNILDSTQLGSVDAEVLDAIARRVDVFARVSPAHKLRIVQAMQRAGKVVAMTGDGINDGPALKAADIGIAMGNTGTDVAREVADVVLEDDNLETMIAAVSQGRTIYSNIRKSVRYLLATNMSEIMVTFGAVAAGAGQPLTTAQLLWINIISDVFPSLALAFEPPEPDVLCRPPRDPGEPIIKPADFKRIGFESAVLSVSALGAYGYGLARYGPGPRAGSIAFMSLTLGQLLHAISCRSETISLFDSRKLPPNPYLTGALGGTLALQLSAAVIPPLRNLLGITSIAPGDSLVIGGAALVPLLINEGTKRAVHKGAP
jgi:Ca2+-transporting ATPase